MTRSYSLEIIAKTNRYLQLRKRIAAKWNSDTPASSIFRNMAMLASGTGVAKVIGIVSVPIITRIYLPEHMGVLSVFTALAVMKVYFYS